jgi:hypothetical protein
MSCVVDKLLRLAGKDAGFGLAELPQLPSRRGYVS